MILRNLNKRFNHLDKSYRKFINDCDNYANEKMKAYSKNNIKNRKYSKVEDYAQDNKAQKEKYKRQFAKKNIFKSIWQKILKILMIWDWN